PLQFLAIEFRRTPKQRLGLQRSPAATPILRQPAIDRRTIDAQNISNNFRACTILNTAHRTLTHRLQCGVIQSSRIVCPHAQRQSYSRRHVKKSLLTYVLINKSEAGALSDGFCGEKGLERFGQDIRWHPGPSVADRDADILSERNLGVRSA